MQMWSQKVSASLRRWRRECVDPFAALEVQFSLSRVEAHIAALLADETRFARGHHLRAARLAYDHLLHEACALAGVGELPEEPALRRVLAEAELRSRGWTW